MNKKFVIVVLSGKARSGKNTTTSYLREKLNEANINSAELMIAKPIKDYTKEHFGWDGKEETKPRTFLQNIGNHIRFDLNMPNLLIDRCCQDAKILSEYIPVIFISDCRFRQELYFFKAYFPDNLITIRMERPNFINPLSIEQQNHITEIDLDGVKDWDFVISADNVDEIYDVIKKNSILEIIKNKIQI